MQSATPSGYPGKVRRGLRTPLGGFFRKEVNNNEESVVDQ